MQFLIPYSFLLNQFKYLNDLSGKSTTWKLEFLR